MIGKSCKGLCEVCSVTDSLACRRRQHARVCCSLQDIEARQNQLRKAASRRGANPSSALQIEEMGVNRLTTRALYDTEEVSSILVRDLK